MVLYTCEKFYNNISNGFQLTERTQVHNRNSYVQSSKGITPKVGKPELQFMCSACRLIVLYICVKFCENISDSLRVMEQTQMTEVLMDGKTDGWMDRHSKFQEVLQITLATFCGRA